MTPESLEQLRDASRSGLYLTIAEALELCDEVDRLREELEVRRSGIRDGRWEDPVGDYWRDYWRQRALEAEDFGIDLRNFQRAVESAHKLLNPTGGEDHE